MQVQQQMKQLEQAAAFIASKSDIRPKIGIILGTGLNGFVDQIDAEATLPYRDIPHFPVSTAPDHAGRLVIGRLYGRPVAVMQGRVHYYEGYSMADVVFPVRVLRLLGIQTLIVTNAAGGINNTFRVGDLVLLSDHIKFFNDTPLRGPNLSAFGPRFNDMCSAYPQALRDVAKSVDSDVREGVYAYMPGPCFETPAEIRMLRLLGADVVGMSTVPEVIAAVHAGMRVLGISFVTNMAADLVDEICDIELPESARKRFGALLCGVVEKL